MQAKAVNITFTCLGTKMPLLKEHGAREDVLRK